MAETASLMIDKGRTDPPQCDVEILLQAALLEVEERVSDAQLAAMAAAVIARMRHAQRLLEG